jgi:hypothetical protein
MSIGGVALAAAVLFFVFTMRVSKRSGRMSEDDGASEKARSFV